MLRTVALELVNDLVNRIVDRDCEGDFEKYLADDSGNRPCVFCSSYIKGWNIKFW